MGETSISHKKKQLFLSILLSSFLVSFVCYSVLQERAALLYVHAQDTPPVSLSTDPVDGQTGIVRDKVIRVTFNEPVYYTGFPWVFCIPFLGCNTYYPPQVIGCVLT